MQPGPLERFDDASEERVYERRTLGRADDMCEPAFGERSDPDRNESDRLHGGRYDYSNMRVILACKDPENADWLAHVLGEDGLSVVVLPDVAPDSPELRGAELLIVDGASAAALGDAGPIKRVLISARGATVDLTAVQGRFSDILVIPAPSEEVVARVRHVMATNPKG